MELKELVEETMNIFQVRDTEDLGAAVFETIRNEEIEKYDSFCNMTNDLSKDWMQMIFQYYQADRKEKSKITHRSHWHSSWRSYQEIQKSCKICVQGAEHLQFKNGACIQAQNLNCTRSMTE